MQGSFFSNLRWAAARPIGALVFAVLFLLLAQGWAGADEGWAAKSFDSRIAVNPDSTVSVQETIKVDFVEAKHGIFRDIPVSFQGADGQAKTIELELRGVTDEQGMPCQTEVTESGEHVHIRVGDPNVTVTGVHTYVISYHVSGALQQLEDSDEICWNATGHDWPVTIESATATVVLPKSIKPEGIRAEIYAGPFGAGTGGGDLWHEVRFVAKGPLSPGEGLTVAVAWPLGALASPATLVKGNQGVAENYGLLSSLLLCSFAAAMFLTRGRMPRLNRSGRS